MIDFVRKYYRVDFKGALRHLGINGNPATLTPHLHICIEHGRVFGGDYLHASGIKTNLRYGIELNRFAENVY